MGRPEIHGKTAGYEWDAFSIWRHWLCFMTRAGVTKKLKNSYRRRMRRAHRVEAQRGLIEYRGEESRPEEA